WPLLRMARAINRAAVAESGFPQNLKRLDASGQMPSVFLGCNGRDIKRPPRDMTAWPFRFVAALARMDKGPARFAPRRRDQILGCAWRFSSACELPASAYDCARCSDSGRARQRRLARPQQ